MASFPRLKPDPEIDGAMKGGFRTFTGPVQLHLARKAADDTQAYQLAKTVCGQFSALEQRAKQCATESLLETYNDCWRIYERIHQNGESETVENETLSARGFAMNLVTKALEISDSTSFCFWFDTKELFGGHGILVTFRDGINGPIDAALWG